MGPIETPWSEATLASLYDSAVEAFPRTRKRQHAVDPVKIVGLEWTPFLGLRTLLVRGRAVNEGREYRQLVLFKGVLYHEGGDMEVVADGRSHRFDQLSLDNSEALVRCDCPDFRWRFAYYNHRERSLYGRKPARYTPNGSGPPANPLQMEGMCKHLMKLAQELEQRGIIANALQEQ